jgi:hypothetical protein
MLIGYPFPSIHRFLQREINPTLHQDKVHQAPTHNITHETTTKITNPPQTNPTAEKHNKVSLRSLLLMVTLHLPGTTIIPTGATSPVMYITKIM